MYHAHQTLAVMNGHKWAIIAVAGLALPLNIVFFVAALRQARRDRAYSIPIFTTLFWLCGDSSFLWHYDKWFHTYKNWYPEFFWFGLLLTVAFEVAFTIQVVQYGRAEHLPHWTQRQWTALVLAGVGAAIVVWSMIRHVITDPLWITYFDLATVAGPLAGAALLIRRRSRAGQSPLIWITYTLMAACYFTAELLWFGPPFRSSEFIAMAVVSVAGSAAVAYVVIRMPSVADSRSDLEPASVVEPRRAGPALPVGLADGARAGGPVAAR
jgi:hypothetical protein